MDEQVGWAVRYRSENTDPESEAFGTVIEWWELFTLNQQPPSGAVAVYTHEIAEPQAESDGF